VQASSSLSMVHTRAWPRISHSTKIYFRNHFRGVFGTRAGVWVVGGLTKIHCNIYILQCVFNIYICVRMHPGRDTTYVNSHKNAWINCDWKSCLSLVHRHTYISIQTHRKDEWCAGIHMFVLQCVLRYKRTTQHNPFGKLSTSAWLVFETKCMP